jgi:hypothetical protein
MSLALHVYHDVANVLESPAKLCDSCEPAVLKLLNGEPVNMTFGKSVEDCKKSNQNGCSICFMFLASVNADAAHRVVPRQKILIQNEYHDESHRFDGRLSLYFDDGAKEHTESETVMAFASIDFFSYSTYSDESGREIGQ